MIIEFTGCTASGKSTLAAKVTKQLSSQGYKTVSSTSFLLKSLKLKRLSNPTIQNILLDIRLLPLIVYYLGKNLKFYLFFCKILFSKPYSFLGAVNRLRSVIRKIATNEILKKNNHNDQIIIVDEGMVHSVHNIFVYSHRQIYPKEIKVFSELISLPDLLICVTAPQDVILDRTLSRKEKRQIFDPKNKKEEYIERACLIFEEILKAKSIRKIAFHANMDNQEEDKIDEQANKVVHFILKHSELNPGYTSC